jgi:hypothetical protein
VKDYAPVYDSFDVLSPRRQLMTLKISLDDGSFHSLKECIPPASRSTLLLQEAVRLEFFGSNAVITCTEAEARTLLLYAEHCPDVIASINEALRCAGFPLEVAKNDQR